MKNKSNRSEEERRQAVREARQRFDRDMAKIDSQERGDLEKMNMAHTKVNASDFMEGDVVINDEGVIGYICLGRGNMGQDTLGIVNDAIGLKDYLDVFPEGYWHFVGNVSKTFENAV